MSRILLLCVMIFSFQPLFSQDKGLVFDNAEHDFGRIAERGKSVKHTFEFENRSDEPIVITRISTTCRCTSCDFSKRPVLPGQRGRITVTYNPRRQEGVFHKVVQIFTNAEPGRAFVTIKGNVIK